jgi:Ca2+-transporting ATPase
MRENPRPRSEGILTGTFLRNVLIEGIVIAAATIAAFHIGLRMSEAAGSTMAFATLCLSRLFHGFSCKAHRPILFSRKLWDNRTLLVAFLAGTALLAAVLLIPAVAPFFHVAALSAVDLGSVAGMAVSSMLVIQLLKAIRTIRG